MMTGELGFVFAVRLRANELPIVVRESDRISLGLQAAITVGFALALVYFNFAAAAVAAAGAMAHLLADWSGLQRFATVNRVGSILHLAVLLGRRSIPFRLTGYFGRGSERLANCLSLATRVGANLIRAQIIITITISIIVIGAAAVGRLSMLQILSPRSTPTRNKIGAALLVILTLARRNPWTNRCRLSRCRRRIDT